MPVSCATQARYCVRGVTCGRTTAESLGARSGGLAVTSRGAGEGEGERAWCTCAATTAQGDPRRSASPQVIRRLTLTYTARSFHSSTSLPHRVRSSRAIRQFCETVHKRHHPVDANGPRSSTPVSDGVAETNQYASTTRRLHDHSTSRRKLHHYEARENEDTGVERSSPRTVQDASLPQAKYPFYKRSRFFQTSSLIQNTLSTE
ncbi:unnamed protein product [Plutella xylostella]|uniref:(diamondback moth) hypothetical protein n=1 Tax=Plutella xylostella TaxID=51655 RepID=A0A8S4FYR7_PLUXY|nr:unnamed protein product [Plutella xylostella]